MTLRDNVSKQANAILRNVSKLNTTVTTRVKMITDSKGIQSLQKSLTAMNSQSGGISLAGFMRPLDAIASKLSNIKQQFKDIFKPPETGGLEGWISKIGGLIKGLGTAGLGLTAVFTATGVVIAAITGLFMKKWVDQSVELNSQMETYQVQLKTTLGSLSAAKKEMAGIVTFAKETPFEISEITAAVVKLRAYAMDSDKWLKPLGDMAAAFGRPITDAVEASADAVMGMFRRALSYGIKMEKADFKQGGKYAGMTYAEAFYGEITKRFAGGMKLQSNTFKGIMSNIKDVLNMSLVKLGGPIFDKVKSTVQKIFTFMQSAQATAAIDSITTKIARAVQEFGDIVAPIVSSITSTILPALVKLGSSLVKISAQVIQMFGGPIMTALNMVLVPILKIGSEFLALSLKISFVWKALLAYSIFKIMFKAISVGIWESAAAMTALGTQGNIAAVAIGKLTTRLIAMFALFAGFKLVSDFIEINDMIKSIGGSIKTVDDNIDGTNLKGYLQDLSQASGEGLKSVVAGALAAKDLGVISQATLEAAAFAARDLGISTAQAVPMIGSLASTYVDVNDSAEEAAAKIREISAALIYMKQNEKGLGIDFDTVRITLEKYPDVATKIAGGFKEVIELIRRVGASGANLNTTFEALQMLLNPDENMIMKLPSETWISRYTEDAHDLGKVIADLQSSTSEDVLGKTFKEAATQIVSSMTTVKSTLDSYAEAIKTDTGLTGEFVEQASYGIPEIQAAYRAMYADVENLTAAIEYWNGVIEANNDEITANKLKLHDLDKALEQVNYEIEKLSNTEPEGTAKLADYMGKLDQAIKQIDLQSFRMELDWLNNSFAAEEAEIRRLNSALEDSERGLTPLKNELATVEEAFDEVSKAITDAQSRLDEFTNPRLAGMRVFDDQIQAIDSKLNKLKREKLDIMDDPTYRTLEARAQADPRVKDTAQYKEYMARIETLDNTLAGLENDKDKLELDRHIAYDDQLYQLEKIADTEKEITFSEAISGATAARKQLEQLAPQLDAITKSKDDLSAVIDSKQKEIDAQKQIIDLRQSELDTQKAIREAAKDELDTQKQKLVIMQNIAQAEYDIMSYEFLRSKAESLKQLEAQKNAITDQQRPINNLVTDLTYENEVAQGIVSDRQGSLTKIQGWMSDLIKAFPDMISKVDSNVITNMYKPLLDDVLGPTFAANIDKIAKNSTPGNLDTAGVAAADKKAGAGSPMSAVSDLWGYLTGSWTGVAVGGAGLAGLWFGKKYAGKMMTDVLNKLSTYGIKRAATGARAGSIAEASSMEVKRMAELARQYSTQKLPSESGIGKYTVKGENGKFKSLKTDLERRALELARKEQALPGYIDSFEKMQLDSIKKAAIRKPTILSKVSDVFNRWGDTKIAVVEGKLDDLAADTEKKLAAMAEKEAKAKLLDAEKRARILLDSETAAQDTLDKARRTIAKNAKIWNVDETHSPKAQEKFDIRQRHIAEEANKRADMIERQARTKLSRMPEMPERTITDGLRDQLAEAKKSGNMKKVKVIVDFVEESMPSTARKGKLATGAAKAADIAGAVPRIVKNTFLGITGYSPVKHGLENLSKLTSGKGGVITAIRGLMVDTQQVLGNVLAFKKGTPKAMMQRMASLGVGSSLTSRVMGRVRSFVGGGQKGSIAIPGALADAGEFLGRQGGKAGGIISSLKGGVATGIGKISGLVGKVPMLAKVFKGAFAALDPISSILTNKVFSKVAGVGVGKIASKAIPIIGWLSLLGDAQTLIKHFTGKGIGDWWKESPGLKWIAEHNQDAGNMINKAAKGIDSLLGVFQGLSGILGGAGQIVVGSLIGIVKGLITGDWSSIGKNIKEGADMMWRGVKDIGVSIWEGVKVGFSGFVDFWQMVWHWVTDPFRDAGSWVIEHVKTWPGAVWEGLKDLGKFVYDSFKDIYGYVTSPFISAWNWLVGETGPSSWPGKIAGWFTGVYNWFTGTVWGGIQTLIVQPFSNALNSIKTFFVNLPTTIWNNVVSAGQQLIDAGKKIWEYVWAGLKGAFNSVKDIAPISWLLSLGGGAINVIKDAAQKLGIGSYADGGISTGPLSGYTATLHGTEAIIPLKNGSVPVALKGDSGGRMKVEVTLDSPQVLKVLSSIDENTSHLPPISDALAMTELPGTGRPDPNIPPAIDTAITKYPSDFNYNEVSKLLDPITSSFKDGPLGQIFRDLDTAIKISARNNYNTDPAEFMATIPTIIADTLKAGNYSAGDAASVTSILSGIFTDKSLTTGNSAGVGKTIADEITKSWYSLFVPLVATIPETIATDVPPIIEQTIPPLTDATASIPPVIEQYIPPLTDATTLGTSATNDLVLASADQITTMTTWDSNEAARETARSTQALAIADGYTTPNTTALYNNEQALLGLSGTMSDGGLLYSAITALTDSINILNSTLIGPAVTSVGNTVTQLTGGVFGNKIFEDIFNNVPKGASGGYVAQTGLAIIHKGETLTPANSKTGVTNYVTIEKIEVRDDNDLEEIKKAILSLREGQNKFTDSPKYYGARF